MCGTLLFATYIPDDNGAGSPTHTSLCVLRKSDVIVQELEEVVRFLLFVSHDVTRDC